MGIHIYNGEAHSRRHNTHKYEFKKNRKYPNNKDTKENFFLLI